MGEHFENLVCPACGAAVESGFRLGGYRVAACGGCGFAWVTDSLAAGHVAEVYGDTYFSGGGAGYADYGAEAGLLVRRGARYGRILKRYGEPGRLLDVGAAAGYLMEGFRSEGWEVSGIEPNDAMAASGRGRGLELRTGVIEEFDGDEGRYDAVSMVQVAAHFLDVDRALDAVGRLLRPGGLLLVETWDRLSVAARVFGKKWHEYSPPSTLRWFTRASLEKMVGARGFEPLACRKTVKAISFGHARSLASAKWKLARIVLKAAAWVPEGLPIPYLSDDLMWAVYRKGCHGEPQGCAESRTCVSTSSAV